MTSHTKEIIQTFWALSKELADARHYPAIDWVGSFSDHVDKAAKWWADNVSGAWKERRAQALTLLSRDAELSRIVNLVGPEALSHSQRWELESALLVKEAVLQQSALDPIDTFCSPEKQFALLDLTLLIHQIGAELIDLGVPVQELTNLPLMAKVRRLKETYRSDQISAIRAFGNEVQTTFDNLRVEYAKQESPI